MVGEASGRMQKADCRDEIALPAAMLAWLKYRKQRTRNSRKRFLVFFCSLFVKARVVYRLRRSGSLRRGKSEEPKNATKKTRRWGVPCLFLRVNLCLRLGGDRIL